LQAPLLQFRRPQQGAHSAGHDAPQRQVLTGATCSAAEKNRGFVREIPGIFLEF
jgi:hypothetical protein